MRLKSCDKCGVILDTDKIDFPDDITNTDGSIDDSLGVWDGDNYVAYVSCPVCRSEITE